MDFVKRAVFVFVVLVGGTAALNWVDRRLGHGMAVFATLSGLALLALFFWLVPKMSAAQLKFSLGELWAKNSYVHGGPLASVNCPSCGNPLLTGHGSEYQIYGLDAAELDRGELRCAKCGQYLKMRDLKRRLNG
jgi:hypothetical protein